MGVDTTTLTVNGVRRVFSMGSAFGQVPYSETLLETLRDRLGLTGAKRACDEGACGCCTPGIIMTTTALLNKNPNPSEEEVRDALSGNYCRCISQYHVFEAIASVAGRGVELDEKWEGRR